MSDQFWQTNTDMAKHYDSISSGVQKLPVLPALELIHRSGVLNTSPPLKILDNACGPAVITELMYDDLAKKYKEGSDFSILCADLGPAMIEISKEKIEKKGWKGITAEVLDQNDLSSLGDGTFTHVLTGLGINFVKDADKVLQEINRILVPGGINAFSTWETVGWIEHVREALGRIPGAPPFPTQQEGFHKLQHGNKWENKEWIRERTSKYFDQVDIYDLPKIHTLSAEEFVKTFGGPMTQGMLSLFWGEEHKTKYGPQLEDTLRELLQEKKMDYVDLQMDALITVAKKAL